MLQEHVASACDWSSGVCTTYLCSTTLYALVLRSVTLAGSGVTRGMDAELVTRPRRRSEIRRPCALATERGRKAITCSSSSSGLAVRRY
jgi:hypothetical protein